MSSSKYPERWIVPGGGVEQDETNAETAVRELLEEAGVVGRLGRCLGVFEVSNKVAQVALFVNNVSLFRTKNTNIERKFSY